MTIILYILFFYSIKYIGDGMYSLLGRGDGPWCCCCVGISKGINATLRCATLRCATQPATQRTDDIQGYLDLTLWQNYWTT